MAFTEVLDDVFVFRGRSRFAPGLAIGKLMTVVRRGGELTVLNSARLDDDDERALRALGMVKHVVRLGASHGLDDAWFVERFAPVTWAMPNMRQRASGPPQRAIVDGGELPFEGSVIAFRGGRADEAVVRLPQDGGVLIACDALQAWSGVEDCSWLGGAMVRRMGFLSAPVVVGPIWLKKQSEDPTSLRADFDRVAAQPSAHLIAGHGAPLLHRARDEVRACVARLYEAAA